MRRAISSARPASRSTQATAAPAAARLGQIPCPSPPPAPVTIATRPVRSKRPRLIGRPLAYERGGGEGEPGGSPSVSKKGAAWWKHGFPPRERAEGERRSCPDRLREHLLRRHRPPLVGRAVGGLDEGHRADGRPAADPRLGVLLDRPHQLPHRPDERLR